MQDKFNLLPCILVSYKVVNNYPTLSTLMLFLRTLLALKRAFRG